MWRGEGREGGNVAVWRGEGREGGNVAVPSLSEDFLLEGDDQSQPASKGLHPTVDLAVNTYRGAAVNRGVAGSSRGGILATLLPCDGEVVADDGERHCREDETKHDGEDLMWASHVSHKFASLAMFDTCQMMAKT